jgi:hypothetical protein
MLHGLFAATGDDVQDATLLRSADHRRQFAVAPMRGLVE